MSETTIIAEPDTYEEGLRVVQKKNNLEIETFSDAGRHKHIHIKEDEIEGLAAIFQKYVGDET